MALLAAITRFFNTNSSYLPPASRRVLVGVSGGPDSTALLHTLYSLREKLELEIEVAHLDHALRGKEAEADAQYVAGLCATLVIPCHLERREVKVLAAEKGLGIEETARLARYNFFARILKERHIPLLLLAHNANDQAETVLMRILRGSGPQGLAGMLPLAPFPPNLVEGGVAGLEWRVGRPLLEVWRKEIELYCAENGLTPRHDSSNTDPKFTRNRLRHELLPLLEEKYFKGATANLARLARLAATEEEWLAEISGQEFERLAKTGPGWVSFPVANLLDCHLALQRRLLRLAYKRVAGSLLDLEEINISQLLEMLSVPVKQLDLPGGVRGLVYNGELLIGHKGSREPEGPQVVGELPLPVPGEVRLGDWKITVEVQNLAGEFKPEPGNWRVTLDADRVGLDLLIRGRKPGEKFRPLGAPGRKKLQDFMVDAHIPPGERERWPLLVQVNEDEGIVWVVGHALAEPFKVTPDTRRILILEATKS